MPEEGSNWSIYAIVIIVIIISAVIVYYIYTTLQSQSLNTNTGQATALGVITNGTSPVANATVTFYPTTGASGSGLATASAITDEFGNYSLTIATGTYNITVVSGNLSGSITRTISNGANTINLNF